MKKSSFSYCFSFPHVLESQTVGQTAGTEAKKVREKSDKVLDSSEAEVLD